MKPFLIALLALYALLAAIAALLGGALWLGLAPPQRGQLLDLLAQGGGLTLFALLLALLALGMLFERLYRRYVLAPQRLREQVLVMTDSNRGLRLQPGGGAAQLCALSQAINQLAEQRDALQRDMEQQVRAAAASVEQERNRLAALMAELAQAVIVCNLDGLILLYNQHARQLFQARGAALIGLGRAIFAVMEADMINHALETIRHSQTVARFITSVGVGQLIRVQMAPVQEERGLGGYVLILEDITRSFELDRRRDALLQSLTEGSRGSLANLRAALENLLDYPDMAAGQRDRFLAVMRDEVRAMSRRLDQADAEYANTLKSRWPLEEMPGIDLAQAARQWIEQHLGMPATCDDIDHGLWLRVDSFSLLQALTHLAARLQEELKVSGLRFRLTHAGRLAYFDLLWCGSAIGSETLLAWELEPMRWRSGSSPLTLREVIERHGGELWCQRDPASGYPLIRLLIPVAAARQMPPMPAHGISRPAYYDFDLFEARAENRALDERLLSELSYTAFDTETTGLDPAGGDEIIQIGAVRIVNGRLLKEEAFDQLVDARRAIAPEAFRVHGISREMLRGQPPIEAALRDFHAFCADTVLVGHNAAFDLRFLQMKESAAGVSFRQPLLDTLLLSALIHPNQESHQLEAIAERLGVRMVARHSALGDAIITGEAFLKMIPLLAGLGIRTLGQAREASRRSYYAKVKY